MSWPFFTKHIPLRLHISQGGRMMTIHALLSDQLKWMFSSEVWHSLPFRAWREFHKASILIAKMALLFCGHKPSAWRSLLPFEEDPPVQWMHSLLFEVQSCLPHQCFPSDLFREWKEWWSSLPCFWNAQHKARPRLEPSMDIFWRKSLRCDYVSNCMLSRAIEVPATSICGWRGVELDLGGLSWCLWGYLYLWPDGR